MRWKKQNPYSKKDTEGHTGIYFRNTFQNSKEAVLSQLNTSGAKARLYSLFLPSPGGA